MTDLTIPENLPRWIREHTELYVKDGAQAHDWDSSKIGSKGILSTLLLVTTGRKSGRKLALPLVYIPAHNDAFCVVASKGGSPEHPAWYLNLMASPNVQIKVKDQWLTVKARVATGSEREQLWQNMVENEDSLAHYQGKIKRQIPVVVLEPQ